MIVPIMILKIVSSKIGYLIDLIKPDANIPDYQIRIVSLNNEIKKNCYCGFSGVRGGSGDGANPSSPSQSAASPSL